MAKSAEAGPDDAGSVVVDTTNVTISLSTIAYLIKICDEFAQRRGGGRERKERERENNL